MKMDFHTHAKLAKNLPFSAQYIDFIFDEAAKAGLNAVCLTEHFNTEGFDKVYSYIEETYVKEGDSFKAGSLRVFPGMEVDIAEGGHILIIGKMDDIAEINRQLEDHKIKGSFMHFAQLLELTKEFPIIIGAGHPFREGGHIPELPDNLLSQLSFIDMNGKDVAADQETTLQQVHAFAQHLKLPVLAGSDTHQSFQYGCIYNDFTNDCSTIKELSEEIMHGNYNIEIAENVVFKVKTARILKHALKEIDFLGGDYVSVLLNRAE